VAQCSDCLLLVACCFLGGGRGGGGEVEILSWMQILDEELVVVRVVRDE